MISISLVSSSILDSRTKFNEATVMFSISSSVSKSFVLSSLCSKSSNRKRIMVMGVRKSCEIAAIKCVLSLMKRLSFSCISLNAMMVCLTSCGPEAGIKYVSPRPTFSAPRLSCCNGEVIRLSVKLVIIMMRNKDTKIPGNTLEISTRDGGPR